MLTLNEEIGTRIVQLRKEHHMTQEQLAEALDISIKHCSCVERGVSSLSLERFIDLCDILDTNLDYLIRGKKDTALEQMPSALRDTFENAEEEEVALLREMIILFSKIKKLGSHAQKQT